MLRRCLKSSSNASLLHVGSPDFPVLGPRNLSKASHTFSILLRGQVMPSGTAKHDLTRTGTRIFLLCKQTDTMVAIQG
eukprot:3225167-Amphidinium_carterae.1